MTLRGLLKAVSYELFEFEDAPESSLRIHKLDRQIRLTLDDNIVLFISWSSDPTQYCIGVSDQSFFSDEPFSMMEMSHSPLWSPLAGTLCDLSFIDPDHQVLKISSANGAVYIMSYESGVWYADTLSIAGEAIERKS